MKTKHILISAGVAASVTTAQAALTSVAGSGWSSDIVIEKTAAFSQPGSDAVTNGHINHYRYYETGWGSTSQGLVSYGTYGPYQLQSYTANNAMVNSGIFTLTTAASYSSLNFMVSTQGINNAFTMTVNYTDSTNDVLTSTGGTDWTNNAMTPKIVTNPGLFGDSVEGYNFYTGSLSITERSIALDPSKMVQSVTLATSSGNVALHAVAGQLVPEPTSAALLGLGGLALTLRRRKS